MLPFAPGSIPESGCGCGMATPAPAEASAAEEASERLRSPGAGQGLGDRGELREVDTARPGAPDRSWPGEAGGVIRPEGGACVGGVERGPEAWPPRLRSGGAPVLSGMVPRTETPGVGLRRELRASRAGVGRFGDETFVLLAP